MMQNILNHLIINPLLNISSHLCRLNIEKLFFQIVQISKKGTKSLDTYNQNILYIIVLIYYINIPT